MNQQSGTSLISVMIAAVILAIISLFAIKLQENILSGQKYVERRYSVQEIFEDIRTFMGNARVCRKSLEGLRLPTASVPQIKDVNGDMVYEENAFYENGNIELSSIALSRLYPEFPGSNNGLADLTLTFLPRANALGSEFVGTFHPRIIRLSVELDPNNGNSIKNCISIAGTNDANWQYGANEDLYYMGNFVGIGTNAPRSRLDVRGNIRVDGAMDVDELVTNGAMYVGSADALVCSNTTEGTQRHRIFNGESSMQFCSNDSWKTMKDIWQQDDLFIYAPLTRSVGIGVNAPNVKLDVKGSSRFQGTVAMIASPGSSLGLVVRGKVQIAQSSSSANAILDRASTTSSLGVKGNVKIEEATRGVLWFKERATNVRCDNSKKGTIRSKNRKLQYCNGGAWKTLKTKRMLIIEQIESGLNYSCARVTSRNRTTAKCWGSNFWGQLGIGKSGFYNPVPNTVLERGIPEDRLSSYLDNVTEISLGYNHTCAIAGTAKKVYCWGSNDKYKLGAGFNERNSTGEIEFKVNPVLVSGVAFNRDVDKISVGHSHSCAVKNKEVYCWGANNHGQIGNGTVTEFVEVPTKATGIHNAIDVFTSESFTCARLSDGRAKCWGSNWYGQLGNNDDQYWKRGSSIPISVKNLSGIEQLTLGSRHACARLIDKTMWCWGDGESGQLGNGVLTLSNLPVQVLLEISPVSVSLSGVTHISAGHQTCAVIGETGIAMCWGLNRQGELGNGSRTISSLPSKVAGLTKVSKISVGYHHTCAISTETVSGEEKGNTVACWGLNTHGQLGTGLTTVRNSFYPTSALLLFKSSP